MRIEVKEIFKKIKANDDDFESLSYGKGKPDDITVLSMWIQSE